MKIQDWFKRKAPVDTLQKRLGEMEKQNSSVSLAGANQYSHDNLRDSLYFLDRVQKGDVTHVPQKETVDSIQYYGLDDLGEYIKKYIKSIYSIPSQAVRTRKFSRKHLPDVLYSEPYWKFDEIPSEINDLKDIPWILFYFDNYNLPFWIPGESPVFQNAVQINSRTTLESLFDHIILKPWSSDTIQNCYGWFFEKCSKEGREISSELDSLINQLHSKALKEKGLEK